MVNQPSDVVETGTILAGRYRVERQLGKGGMGSVYLVQHLHTEQQLALKLLHAAVVTDEVALTRFRREARAPARINSDHVVQVTDADVAPELGGVPFLVMEWLRGQSLEEVVNERGMLTAEDAVLYLRHAARALDKAQVLGIVHRDLKPENLFLTTREDGTPLVKILDFGIAKLNSGGDGDGRLKATGTGQIFGTPLYMSPEQMKGEADKISPLTDIWALGIIAHRLLTGQEVWSAATLTALIAQIAYEPLPVPSKTWGGLGAGFDAWFHRCCAREPGDRFRSAGEAVSALAAALRVADGATSGAGSHPGRLVVTGPSRDEPSARTAFSATAPASAISGDLTPARPSGGQVRGGPSRAQLAAGAALITLASAIGAWAYVSSRRPPAAAVSPADTTRAATDAATATPQVTVTPSTEAPAASAPAASAAPVKVPAEIRKPPHAPVERPPPPPHTAAPVAPPPPPPPAKPDDPLGTRH